MAYDLKNYSIVELGENEFGIQYTNGPLDRGFVSYAEALDVATRTAASASEIIYSGNPRNLDEAVLQAQEARTAYSLYLGENPTATEEQKEAQAAKITLAEAFVSEYQTQQETARLLSTVKNDFDTRQIENNINNANLQRIALAQEAITIRNNSNSTPEEISVADDRAFQAEIYYNSLVSQSNQEIDTVNPTSFGLSNIFSGINSSINSAISSITTPIMNAGNQVTSFLDGIGNSLSGLGSNLTGGVQSFSGGLSGNTSNTGTSIYDTNKGGVTSSSSDHRVRLTPKPSQRDALFSGILEPLKETNGLVFPYTPTIEYTAGVNYTKLETVHANQDWSIYKNTESITLQVTGTFTAQNQKEAQYYLAAIHFLRALTKMHFGENDENKGLPPPQVLLDGYGSNMFNALSVIVTNYRVDLQNTVDYVAVQGSGGTSWVPAISDISVSLVVQQTPRKAREFDWNSFASGELMKKGGWL